MSTLNFNTSNSTFRQLFGNGLKYKVPSFQRDYSWGDDEWDDLWQDIMALFDEDAESAHYMGYLVLQSSDNKVFEIIDGQQRLTTISILILATLSCLQDFVDQDIDADKNAQRKTQLQNSYIGYIDPVSLIPHSKLELNRHNNRFYQNYLVSLQKIPKRGLKISEHQLRKSFEWFKNRIKKYVGDKIDSGEKAAQLIDSLVDKLFFTVITVSDELNAFKVFETLNARGVKLSSTDLLKNYLFSLIGATDPHESELKSLEESWEKIVELLGNENFPEFLRVFYNSRNKLVRKSDLFKQIRKKVKTREEAYKMLRALEKSAGIYASLRDPHDNIWNEKERNYFKQLMMFNVRQPLSMLLACYETFFEESRQSFTKILKSIVMISFRYNVICNLPSFEIEGKYNEISCKISNENSTYQEILNSLKSIYPQDKVFKQRFCDKELRTINSRNKKVVRYILFQLEKQKSNQDYDFESNMVTIEHILPQNPSDDWDYLEEEKQDQLIYRLANMTLLNSTQNIKLGTKSFQEKCEVYKLSEFDITKSIPNHYETWNENKIESRQKQMADLALNIWRIDFGNDSKNHS